jgi:RHS repeat-associated protein
MNPNWHWSELYAAGLHVATYANGSSYFDHSDWLGTVRAHSGVTGSSVETCTSLSFGDSLNCVGYQPGLLHFTGELLDAESNLHHFLFRQNSTTQGRWMTPDPAGLASIDPSDPQSWNRFAYVANSPSSSIDPLGLCGSGQQGDPPCNAPSQSITVTPGDNNISWLDLAIEGGFNVTDAWLCSALGVCGGQSAQTSSNKSGTSPTNTRVPNTITYSTALPNGRTVGSYVSQLSNSLNQQGQVAPVSTPYGPAPNPSLPGPISVASQVFSGTNFRRMFGGPGANYAFLGDAGNFAYGAVSANLGVSPWTTKAVAGAYSVWAHPISDWGGPWLMDPSARVQVPAGYNAACKN